MNKYKFANSREILGVPVKSPPARVMITPFVAVTWSENWAWAAIFTFIPVASRPPAPKKAFSRHSFSDFSFFRTFSGDFNLQKLPLRRLEALWE